MPYQRPVPIAADGSSGDGSSSCATFVFQDFDTVFDYCTVHAVPFVLLIPLLVPLLVTALLMFFDPAM